MTGNDSCEGDGTPSYGPWVWTAYRAYNELLKEKVKKRFDAQEGPWMDKLADQLVALVNARWEGGRKGDQAEEEILGRIRDLLKE